MRRSSLSIVLLLSVALSGCGTEPLATESPAPVAAATPAPPSPTYVHDTSWDDVELVKVDYEQWERELEAMRGGIVVVDLWATWCAPCLERFPKMVEMAEQYGPSGVTFVSMSLDDRDDELTVDEVTAFLEKHEARFPNFLMDEVIPDAFEKLDLLGIPAVFIYDENGTLRYRLTGDDPNNQFTDRDVEHAVEELLGVV